VEDGEWKLVWKEQPVKSMWDPAKDEAVLDPAKKGPLHLGPVQWQGLAAAVPGVGHSIDSRSYDSTHPLLEVFEAGIGSETIGGNTKSSMCESTVCYVE
jgi:hypothetical protein